MQQSWREHQRFSHVPRVSSTSTDQKCWVGMCLQSPIQWNWFHPATPRSRELLISQVWNCSERSSRRRTSGSREKDWKVELKLADIWCILLLQSISFQRCKYIFVLLIFSLISVAMQSRFLLLLFTQQIYLCKQITLLKVQLVDALVSFLNRLIRIDTVMLSLLWQHQQNF